MADQSKIPLIIYNWPQATGVDIAPDAVAQLSEHPNIIAIKESSGNLEKVMQMIREVRPGFQVLVGSAPTLWPSLLMGACGAILAYANAAPYSTIAIWEAYRTREEEAGQRLAESDREGRGAGDGEVRRARAEVCDGSERLLRRAAALAAGPAHRRGEEGDRGGVQGFDGLAIRQPRLSEESEVLVNAAPPLLNSRIEKTLSKRRVWWGETAKFGHITACPTSCNFQLTIVVVFRKPLPLDVRPEFLPYLR